MIQRNDGVSVTIDGVDYTYFGGTNYLGLAHRQELIDAAIRAFDQFGMSSGASRVTSGESSILKDLEERLSQFALSESSIVLPAGYLSNLAVVDAVDPEVDAWVHQPGAHKSIMSALAQSKKELHQLCTEDPLRNLQQLARHKKIGVFVEPIEPLTGKLFPLQSLAGDLPDDSYLILDEAHSFGVLGEEGRGAAEEFALPTFDGRLIRTGTLSKALGTQGGFVAASFEIISLIKERSGTYRFGTPLSPVLVASALKSLSLLSQDKRRTLHNLRANIARVSESLRGVLAAHHSRLPIFAMPVPEKGLDVFQNLKDNKLFVPKLSGYFSCTSQVLLRWTIQSNHSEEQLDLLCRIIRQSVE